MTSAGALARSAARVHDIAAAATDSRALRLDTLAELRQSVGFDAYSWLLTDPQTTVGTAPLADVPALDELPALIRRRYLTAANRWTTIEPGAVAVMHDLPAEQVDAPSVWTWLRATYAVGDVASVVFADRFGTWGFLDLWRFDDQPPFGPTERGHLAAIVAPLTAALRRSQANGFVAGASTGDRPIGPTVLVLSPTLEIVGQTPETDDYLRLLVPPPEHRPPVPANAYNVAAQLLAVEAGVDNHPPSARVHLADGLWLTLRAARISERADPEADIAVTIEATAPAGRVDLFGRALGLTAREQELLTLLVSGLATKELARRMYLSEHTVQDHLKSIFAKASVRNRRALVAAALGT